MGRAELIHLFRQVKEPFNVNALAQIMALAALRDHEHIEKTISLNHRGKDFLYGELSGLGLKYIPTEANFIFVDVGGDSMAVFQRMLEG